MYQCQPGGCEGGLYRVYVMVASPPMGAADLPMNVTLRAMAPGEVAGGTETLKETPAPEPRLEKDSTEQAVKAPPHTEAPNDT